MACYTLDLSGSEKAGAIKEGHDCCTLQLDFSSFHEYYYVTLYRYYGDSELLCPVRETSCMFGGYTTTGNLTFNKEFGECYKDYGPMIMNFDNEKRLDTKDTKPLRLVNIGMTVRYLQKLKAVTKYLDERWAAELAANFLRTGVIVIKGKDTLPEFRTTARTTITTTEPVTSTTTVVTSTTRTVTPSVDVVTDTKEVSTVALKAEKSQDSKEKCPSCDNQGLPLIGLGILCLILIAVTIALVMKIRGIQNELKKRDLIRGAGTTMKDPKSSGSSEVKSAPIGIKSTGSGSTDKTVGSKESGSTEKAGPKSVTGGEPIRTKE